MRFGIIDTFNATTTTRVVSASREFMNFEQFVHGGCELKAELRFVARQQGDSEHIRMVDETILEEEGVIIP